jgi:hypothetical protein
VSGAAFSDTFATFISGSNVLNILPERVVVVAVSGGAPALVIFIVSEPLANRVGPGQSADAGYVARTFLMQARGIYII